MMQAALRFLKSNGQAIKAPLAWASDRILAMAVVAISAGSIHAQSCIGQMPSVQPAMLCSNPTSLCLCGPYGTNCHWEWVCPSPQAAGPARIDPSIALIPLSGRPANDPADTMRKMTEIRQMQQQTELLRQQTEALRQQNQQMQPQQPGPNYTPSHGPYLGFAMITMPKPTDDQKRDQRAWEKWRASLAKRDPWVQSSIPPWSPGAYVRFRKMALEQAMQPN
jgi:hypothetical protein